MIYKIRKALDEGGLSLLLQRTYNFVHSRIRSYLPRRIKVLHCGTKVITRLGDSYNTEAPFRNLPYKKNNSKAIEETVEEGDRPVSIGGGRGVNPTRIMSKNGIPTVKVFEPGKKMRKICFRNMKENINHYPGFQFRIYKGFFYASDEVWGEVDEEEKLTVEDIPECDLLEMDCEGAEVHIIPNLVEIEKPPKKLIVEVHEGINTSREEVNSLLEYANYELKQVYDEEEGNPVFVAHHREQIN